MPSGQYIGTIATNFSDSAPPQDTPAQEPESQPYFSIQHLLILPTGLIIYYKLKKKDIPALQREILEKASLRSQHLSDYQASLRRLQDEFSALRRHNTKKVVRNALAGIKNHQRKPNTSFDDIHHILYMLKSLPRNKRRTKRIKSPYYVDTIHACFIQHKLLQKQQTYMQTLCSPDKIQRGIANFIKKLSDQPQPELIEGLIDLIPPHPSIRDTQQLLDFIAKKKVPVELVIKNSKKAKSVFPHLENDYLQLHNITTSYHLFSYFLLAAFLTEKCVPHLSSSKKDQVAIQLFYILTSCDSLSKALKLAYQQVPSTYYSQIRKLFIHQPDLFPSLQLLAAYRPPSQNLYPKILDCFKQYHPNQWEERTHKLLLKDTFQQNQPYTVEQLATKIKSSAIQERIKGLQSSRNLIKWHSEVMTSAERLGRMRRREIKEWADRVKNDPSHYKIEEIIAVLCKAIKLHQGYSPRDVQILALLCFFKSTAQKGLLQQMNTGQGKSDMIAMLAVIHALQGKKVDIVTTSTELSQREAADKASFFKLFNLTVGENSIPFADKKKTKLYEKDIIYGTATNFHGDILHTEFLGEDLRGARGFEVVIVDEVDSLLYDNYDQLTRLAEEIPGMHHLNIVYTTLWNYLHALEENIQEEQGQLFFTDPTIPRENIREGVLLIENKETFLQEKTEARFRSLLQNNAVDSAESTPFPIPHHLKSYVQQQLPVWVKSAINAKYAYAVKKQYDVIDGKIAPIDYQNTGVIQRNMVYGRGLAPALALKENLTLSPKQLATNYLSNIGLFRRYKKNIYGLSGTLGGEITRSFLGKTYQVNTLTIPPHQACKIKQPLLSPFLCKELQPIACHSPESWQQAICDDIQQHVRLGRAVLTILPYIKDVNTIQACLQRLGTTNVYTYTGEHPLQKETTTTGDVILATNIAGRGTDLKTTPELESNGGLHVIMTSLGGNPRIPLQNAGRTARGGKKGTCLFIVHDPQKIGFDRLLQQREHAYKASMQQAAKSAEITLLKEDLFQQFCALLQEVFPRESQQAHHTIRKAVIERWGLWIENHQDQFGTCSNYSITRKFRSFREKIGQDAINDQLVHNPYYYTLAGNQQFLTKEYDKASAYYTRAIDLDASISLYARYNKAMSLLLMGKQQYKEHALHELKKSYELITQQCLPIAFTNYNLVQQTNPSAAFTEQIKKEITFLEVLKLYIEQVTAALQEALKEEKEVRIGSIIPLQSLSQHYQSIDSTQVNQACNNGLLLLFSVSQIQPVPLVPVISLSLLAVSEVGIGCFLTISGIGAPAGVVFISEGITDVIQAVNTAHSREFSLKQYGLEKGISLTSSILCAGVKGYQAKEALKLSGKVFMKESAVHAAKKASLIVLQETSKEVLKIGMNYTLQKVIFVHLQTTIEQNVKPKIRDALLTDDHIRKALQIDHYSARNRWLNQIINDGQKFFRSNTNVWQRFFTGTLQRTLVSLFGSKALHLKPTKRLKKGSKGSKAITIQTLITLIRAGAVPYKLATATEKFMQSFQHEFVQHRAILTREGRRINSILLDPNRKFTREPFDIQTSLAVDRIATQFTKLVSNYLIQEVNSYWVAPITSKIAEKTIHAITHKVEKKLDKEIQAHQRKKYEYLVKQEVQRKIEAQRRRRERRNQRARKEPKRQLTPNEESVMHAIKSGDIKTFKDSKGHTRYMAKINGMVRCFYDKEEAYYTLIDQDRFRKKALKEKNISFFHAGYKEKFSKKNSEDKAVLFKQEYEALARDTKSFEANNKRDDLERSALLARKIALQKIQKAHFSTDYTQDPQLRKAIRELGWLTYRLQRNYDEATTSVYFHGAATAEDLQQDRKIQCAEAAAFVETLDPDHPLTASQRCEAAMHLNQLQKLRSRAKKQRHGIQCSALGGGMYEIDDPTRKDRIKKLQQIEDHAYDVTLDLRVCLDVDETTPPPPTAMESLSVMGSTCVTNVEDNIVTTITFIYQHIRHPITKVPQTGKAILGLVPKAWNAGGALLSEVKYNLTHPEEVAERLAEERARQVAYEHNLHLTSPEAYGKLKNEQELAPFRMLGTIAGELLTSQIGAKALSVVGKGTRLLKARIPARLAKQNVWDNIWKMEAKLRGVIFENIRGHNLPPNYPVIDIFENGIATSIKSINLHDKTYQKMSQFRSKLRQYVKKVAKFKGRDWAKKRIREHEILGRSLDLVIPKGASTAQQKVLQEFIQFGKTKKVTVTIYIY